MKRPRGSGARAFKLGPLTGARADKGIFPTPPDDPDPVEVILSDGGTITTEDVQGLLLERAGPVWCREARHRYGASARSVNPIPDALRAHASNDGSAAST